MNDTGRMTISLAHCPPAYLEVTLTEFGQIAKQFREVKNGASTDHVAAVEGLNGDGFLIVDLEQATAIGYQSTS